MPLQGQKRHQTESQHKDKQHAHVKGQLVGRGSYIAQDCISIPEWTYNVEGAVDWLVGVLVDDDGVVGVPEGGREGDRKGGNENK